jgi:multiple sugar transport system substrate-binding protein
MKKLGSMLLILVLVLSVFTTGFVQKTKNTSAADKVTITFWHGYTPDKEAILKDMISRYEAKNPDVTIVPQFIASGEQMLQKVQTSLLSGELPDILWGFPTWTGVLVSSGKVKALDGLMDSKMKKDVFGGLQQVGSLNGQLYSLPVEAGTLLLIYNKDMFAEAGLKTVPKTWDQLYTAAKVLTNKKHKGIWLPTNPDERTAWTWETFLWQNGGELLNKDGKSVAFGGVNGLEALTMYTKFIKDGLSPINVANDPFIEKQVAMVIATQGAANSYATKYNMNIGVVALPKREKIATGLGSNHLFIFKSNAKKEAAAWDFCKWFVTGNTNAEWVTKTGYLPVSQSAVDSDVYKEFCKQNPIMLIAGNSLKFGVGRPSIEQYTKISDAISSAIQYITFGKKSVSKALNDAVITANDSFK